MTTPRLTAAQRDVLVKMAKGSALYGFAHIYTTGDMVYFQESTIAALQRAGMIDEGLALTEKGREVANGG